MAALFRDRREAGQRLAARLQSLAGRPDVIVLGLPRGGVPVAGEVAAALDAPMDVFVVRKIDVPGHEELAMGAVASGGVRVVNPDIVREAGISRRAFDQVTEREQLELLRRERVYREGRRFPDLRGSTVILVDDGVATGSTMLAAAPVMARQAHRMLAAATDRCECVAMPEPFYGVGMHYEDFAQTSDAEVRSILHRFADGGSHTEAAHARR